MTAVITNDYHYNDGEEPNFHKGLIAIGQRQKPDGSWTLYDSTNNIEVPWNKQAGICYSIDKYLEQLKQI